MNDNRQNQFQTGREASEYEEKILALDRVTRVVKGGRRFRFRATAVIGDGKGKVGVGVGKGGDAPSSIVKAVAKAKRAMIEFPLQDSTIPHEIQVSFGGATVFMKPAAPGTGVIAGGTVRAVLEAAGVSDILTKSLGSSSKINNAYATIEALKQLQQPVKKTEKLKAVAKKKEGSNV
ncbi:MAG: 30S ribosomal protein S5 [Candidatus Saccharibacteria bacterium]